jgi:hypothetical protein
MLFKFAHDSGELSFLHGNCASFRMSLYADDTTLFVSPTAHDLLVTRRLLQFFGDASGLITNLDKSEIFPIRCGDINLDVILGDHFKISQFPCVYLRLPLHCKKIPKHMIQPMVQRIGNKLLGWKRNLLSYPNRELLVKFVLIAIPTHFLTVHKLSVWARRDID